MPPPNNQWAKLSYLRSLSYAIAARQSVLAANTAGINAPLAGDSATKLIAAYQQVLAFGWTADPGSPGTYIRPDWDMDGKTPADALGISGNVDLSRRTYANLPAPATAWMAAHQGTVPTAGSLYGKVQSDTWWRRTKPRTITSLTATLDTDANPAADGQTAYYSPQLGTAGAADFYVAAFNGSTGAWSRAAAQSPPDLLDSSLDRPWFCPPGAAQVGDYCGGYRGEHVWTELEAITNATSLALSAPSATSTNGASNQLIGSGSDSDTNRRAAEQAAVAAWMAQSGAGGGLGASTHVIQSSFGTQNQQWAASVGSVKATITDPSFNPSAQRSTRFYTAPDVANYVVFNAFGTCVRQTYMALAGTAALGGSVAFQSDQPPSTFAPAQLVTKGPAPQYTEGFQTPYLRSLVMFTGLPTVGH